MVVTVGKFRLMTKGLQASHCRRTAAMGMGTDITFHPPKMSGLAEFAWRTNMINVISKSRKLPQGFSQIFVEKKHLVLFGRAGGTSHPIIQAYIIYSILYIFVSPLMDIFTTSDLGSCAFLWQSMCPLTTSPALTHLVSSRKNTACFQ